MCLLLLYDFFACSLACLLFPYFFFPKHFRPILCISITSSPHIVFIQFHILSARRTTVLFVFYNVFFFFPSLLFSFLFASFFRNVLWTVLYLLWFFSVFASVGFSSVCFLSQVDCLIGMIMVVVVVIAVAAAQIHHMMIIYFNCVMRVLLQFFSFSLSLSVCPFCIQHFLSVSNCSTVCIALWQCIKNIHAMPSLRWAWECMCVCARALCGSKQAKVKCIHHTLL